MKYNLVLPGRALSVCQKRLASTFEFLWHMHITNFKNTAMSSKIRR